MNSLKRSSRAASSFCRTCSSPARCEEPFFIGLLRTTPNGAIFAPFLRLTFLLGCSAMELVSSERNAAKYRAAQRTWDRSPARGQTSPPGTPGSDLGYDQITIGNCRASGYDAAKSPTGDGEAVGVGLPDWNGRASPLLELLGVASGPPADLRR